ncbi:MAG: hypothetical protein JW934_21875 [Anaerolineae bacterium]|nr:hypothetical protein [Anaerolineae bacterium]
MGKPLKFRLCLVALFVGVALILPGCAPEDKRLDLETILPAAWKPYATYRLDTNADNQKDWAILYTYDQLATDAFTPVGGVIYHVYSFANQDKAPVVFPYPLTVPGWPYLGEGKSTIELKEVLQNSAGPEVVYQGTNSEGLLTRLALFTWQNHAPSPVLPPEADPTTGQWYHCVGKFDTDARINLEAERVTVWERTNERSQLAIRKIYRPQEGSYMQGDASIAPTQVCLDFAYGQPQDIARSPYPEKILMAFFANLTNEQTVYQFLTKEAADNLRAQKDAWGRITPWPRASLTDICVKELRYAPSQEATVQQQMVILAEKTRDAQKVLATAPATCPNCPEPECTCPPTPTPEPISGPVWVASTVEYTLIDQTRTMYIQWGLVKVNDVWRINQVVVE